MKCERGNMRHSNKFVILIMLFFDHWRKIQAFAREKQNQNQNQLAIFKWFYAIYNRQSAISERTERPVDICVRSPVGDLLWTLFQTVWSLPNHWVLFPSTFPCRSVDRRRAHRKRLLDKQSMMCIVEHVSIEFYVVFRSFSKGNLWENIPNYLQAKCLSIYIFAICERNTFAVLLRENWLRLRLFVCPLLVMSDGKRNPYNFYFYCCVTNLKRQYYKNN